MTLITERAPRPHHVDMILFATAGAVAFGLAFLSAWLITVSHWFKVFSRIVEIFVAPPVETIDALLIGGPYALAAGAVAGALVGGAFNLLAAVFER